MLVLTRKNNETLVIVRYICHCAGYTGDRVKLGIDAQRIYPYTGKKYLML